jgi:hypothetical protein
MASKRIDELDARVVADADLLPVTPSGGPSGKATVAAIVAEGLSQPNSASAGAGASITIKAADGVTSGAGGSITIQPGAQATTGGDGIVVIKSAGRTEFRRQSNDALGVVIYHGSLPGVMVATNNVLGISSTTLPSSTLANSNISIGFYTNILGIQLNGKIQWTSDSSGFVVPDCALVRGSYSVLSLSDGVTAGASFAFPGMTTNISSNQNNLYLPGTGFQRINCTTASDITGISPTKRPDLALTGAHVDGRMIRLVNVGTATVRLMHNDTGSAAANRMYRHNSTNVSLTVNEWADLVYDSTDNGSGAAGWRVVTYA